MKALLIKEFKTIFCSPVGGFFALAFLIVMGAMLWFFSGSYNFIDSGYAGMNNFFGLAPILFAVLIPALTMRQFAEERRNKTFDILLSRPVSIYSIYFSKFLSSFAFVIITLLSTVIYVYSLYQLANPTGNIDMSAIGASYVSLSLLVGVFISIGLFASSITKNQIVALIVAIVVSLFSFFGFDLLAGLFMSGKVQSVLSAVGLYQHYQLMQLGAIQVKDLLVVFNYIAVFFFLSLIPLRRSRRRLTHLVPILLFLTINVIFLFVPNIRFDFTADKRYTLNEYSKKLLQQIAQNKTPLQIDIYLTGNLNAGFQRLQNGVSELLTDFNRHADNSFHISYIDPYTSTTPEKMVELDMPPILLNEVDRDGKVSKQMIYPYAQITNGKDTLVIPLLKRIGGNTADENLNVSLESLEFEFVDAIRLLNQKTPKSVAFIEGHGELSQSYVYDAETALAKYYFVNRGQITHQIGVLDTFDAVIIAGAFEKYTEQEKYIIDQYIMSGGRVLWLLDGAYYSHDELARVGYSASIKNDVNLDDLLFSYGVRINADMIQDRQCASIYLTTGSDAQTSTQIPFFYMPLLIPSPDHPITKDIKDVKARFVSSVESVNNSRDVEKKVLLTSSADAHIVRVPEMVDFEVENIQSQPNYFDQAYIPVAMSLEGSFNSAFTNRMIPDSLSMPQNHNTSNKSSHSRMVVVGASDIIANEIQGTGENSQVLPMGYDRVSQQQFGNREFIVNAVNWLIDDDGWMQLRTKQQQLYILNKKAAYEKRDGYALLNILFPVTFILLIIGGVFFYRKYKYEKR